MNETKQKGLTTELEVQLYFTKLGYNVCVPLGEDCRYDMIVDFDGILTRIQVKTSHVKKNNSGITFRAESTRINSKEVHIKKYSKEQIDYFATMYDGQCYLVRVEECSTDKTLSFKNERKCQYLNFIEDYEAPKIIEKIISGAEEIIEERKVYQYDFRNNLINSYNSISEAARQLGDVHKKNHISQAIRGIVKSAYGYKWTDTLIKS